MNFNKGTFAQLCLVWAFAILLGVTLGLNAPVILLAIYSALLLIG